MPEPRDTSDTDTFDLDAAFDALQRDVATSTRPRGAQDAIGRAGRRRTTRVALAAAAAVAVVAAGAVVLGTRDHDSRLAPADGTVPAPAAFSAASLAAATNGWLDGWATPTKDSPMDKLAALDGSDLETCLAGTNDSAIDNAKDTGETMLVTPSGQLAVMLGVDLGTDSAGTDTSMRLITQGLQACGTLGQATFAYPGDDPATAGYYRAPLGSGDSVEMWAARWHDRIGLVYVLGTDTAPTAQVQSQVADVAMAAMQVDSTFSHQDTELGGSSSSSTSISSPAISDDDFAEALGSWQSGWRHSGRSVDKPKASLPCDTGEWQTNAGETSASGSSLGANGSNEVYVFGSTQQATAAEQSLLQQEQSCGQNAYSTSTVVGPGGVSISVASPANPTDPVAWLVVHGPLLGMITVPGGSTPPPDEVSVRVGALLDGVLSKTVVSTVTNAPEPSGSGEPAPSTSASSTSSSR